MKQYSIFISHSWAYTDSYDKLIKMLGSDPRFNFKDYSVPKNDPIHNAPNANALELAIERQMRFCDVVLVLAGVYASYSKWIDKEIKLAKSYASPKPILAIEPFACSRTSSVVKVNADKIVKWSTGSIVSGIRELS